METKNTNTEQIDSAIAAATARIKAKNGGNAGATPSTGATTSTSPAGTEKSKRTKLTPEQRAERLAAYEKEKADRKALREKQKLEKLAEREANRKPAHMAKVQKAAERLPAMADSTLNFFENITSTLSPADIFILTQNLDHFVRGKRTETASQFALNPGDQVRIKSGNARFVGAVGKVAKAQRIRCYVEVPGYDKLVYLYTSDVEVIKAAEIKPVPEDTEEAQAQAV